MRISRGFVAEICVHHVLTESSLHIFLCLEQLTVDEEDRKEKVEGPVNVSFCIPQGGGKYWL